MVEVQNAAQIEETPDEKRRRLGRERTRKHRAKNATPKEIKNFTEISENWLRNDKQRLATDQELHAQLVARHNEVVELESEAEEIEKGVQKGLRAETLSAATLDPSKIFPMPDLSFQDIKTHALQNGTANYRAIEAATIKGEPLDEAAQLYVRFGFRLRLSHEMVQQARENLVLYALRSKDLTLNWSIVNEAVSDCSFKEFSPHHNELYRLIREHRGL